MIRIEKQYIEKIDRETLKTFPDMKYDKVDNFFSPIVIEQSIIGTLDLVALETHSSVTINKCIINTLYLNFCWFRQGLDFSGNMITNDAVYEAGVHNQMPFIMKDNVFQGFMDFFDCQFVAEVHVTGNIFLQGTTLLGNEGRGWENTFNSHTIIENNYGILDVSE